LFQGVLDAALHLDADAPEQLIEPVNRAADLRCDVLDRRLGRIAAIQNSGGPFRCSHFSGCPGMKSMT
jgi:hypothetical protein